MATTKKTETKTEAKAAETKAVETKAAAVTETKAVAEEKKAPAKKAAAKTTKAAAEKKAPAEKKTAAKTTKAAAEKKEAPAKKAPAKKTTTKKAVETKVEVFVEFGGVQVSIDEVIKNVKLTNGKAAKEITVYLKPEESKAYFVADGNEKEMDVYFC